MPANSVVCKQDVFFYFAFLKRGEKKKRGRYSVDTVQWKMNAWDSFAQETTSLISLLGSLENFSLGWVLS